MIPITCPRCGAFISGENLIGEQAYCPNCAWNGPSDLEKLRRKERRARWWSRSLLALSLAFLTLLCIDALHFGKYMGNHVLIRAKAAVGMADSQDWYNLGLICNTIERWSCSEEAFSKLLALDPRNAVALANMAIAQTHLRKYRSAVANFERLTQHARGTYDMMASMGRALEGIGRDDEAIGWYYRSLALNPHLIDVADRLIDLLAERKEYSEALSVIGSLSYSSARVEALFKGRMIALAHLESKNGKAETHAIRLVSVSDHHFLPISLEGMEMPALFMVDTGASELILSREFLAENGLGDYTFQGNGIATLADGRAVLAKRVVFHRLRVGPWTLNNVSAVVCEGCASLAGQSLLKRFRMSTSTVAGVEYMTLER